VTTGAFKFYEFFAGVGMASIGLGQAWDCAWANDIDVSKAKIYRHVHRSDHLDLADVGQVADDIEAQNRRTVPFPLGVEMAWASFPCQDLSLAGWQRGMKAERSGTYWHFHRIMAALEDRRCRPPILAIENVQGLLYGDSLAGLCHSLAALGMRFGAMLIDAKRFIPQSRPRVFIVAIDDSADVSDFVDPAGGESWPYPKAVHAAYRALPEDLRNRWVWWRLPTPGPRLATASGIFESDPSDVDYHDADATARLLSLMNSRHLGKVEAAKNSGCRRVGFLYKRTRQGQQRAEVRFDGVAGCLRTPKGGSSRQTVVVVEGDSVRTRLLSRIEAARLMGIGLDAQGRLPDQAQPFFPDGLTYNEAYRAMGDGVAVPVVAHLEKHLLTPLAQAVRAEASAGPEVQMNLFRRNASRSKVNRMIAAFIAQAK